MTCVVSATGVSLFFVRDASVPENGRAEQSSTDFDFAAGFGDFAASNSQHFTALLCLLVLADTKCMRCCRPKHFQDEEVGCPDLSSRDVTSKTASLGLMPIA
jgi:hypothetical protein